MGLDFFSKYQALTTPQPMGLKISHAKGSYLYAHDRKKYLDFVAGVSACTLGHSHPRLLKAIKKQLDKCMHVMVYGEFVVDVVTELVELLARCLPDPLDTTYLVNSGTEATEAAMKLAKRATGRRKFIAAKRGYHGNSQGSLSLMDYPERRQPFEPLLPEVDFISFNDLNDLHKIDKQTAGVVLETIQGGAGFILPQHDYLKKVKARCEAVGALLILDEIQPGFGRTGKWFAFEHFDVVPDIVVMGKGMGGGLPVGAFSAPNHLMKLLSHAPPLGHITTFGANPVVAAACLETLTILSSTDLIEQTLEKEQLFRSLLHDHPKIKEIRGKGLMLALILDDESVANQLVLKCMEKGLLLFWLLFEKRAARISPPLTISVAEIKKGCVIIRETLDEMGE